MGFWVFLFVFFVCIITYFKAVRTVVYLAYVIDFTLQYSSLRYISSERVAHVVAAAGFISRCLNSSLSYVRRHLTVNKMY